ncbi:SusD/RagB family nutrient-binding outer membrane lipoprotein [Pedobacter insulae]|uniref:Starch-binding associating with outer membrane n=1 Tax=Pedobacter insulae TaxID=414048 RepID=A0A1I2ZA16_9SPHI|nr:SusD/RagB family nutrient-binding outer membrane lipoprotein [Pedobacter insulae]SFH34687.1 Starch-binding associating with outer membrane [Pedobacter insulae]
MMQKTIKNVLYSAIAVIITLQGCKDDYFEAVTLNPNQVTTPTLPSLLATSTYKIAQNSVSAASITNPFVQYTASPSPNAASDIYDSNDQSGTWNALYYAMADANELKKLAISQNSNEYLGAANVMLAYNLILANDLWGGVPFSEAFVATTLKPKYDSGQAVYTASMALLDEAIANFSAPSTGTLLPTGATNSDMIYGRLSSSANPNKVYWKKFAYALKARLLNKVSKTSSYNPNAVLTAVANSFTSSADDAGMNNFLVRNNWAGVAVSNAAQSLGGWLSEQLVDHLNGTSYGIFDPRIAKITDKAPANGLYIGTTNGQGNRPPGGNTTKDEVYIAQSSPWTSDTAPIWIVTYAELKFIEAEAALAAGLTTQANTAYQAGVIANFDKLQVPAGAERTAYLAAALVPVTRDLIFREKYVATYLNAEAWNDARRYNYAYKNFTMPLGAVLDNYIRRIDYVRDEINENNVNVPPTVPRTTRLWWDQ